MEQYIEQYFAQPFRQVRKLTTLYAVVARQSFGTCVTRWKLLEPGIVLGVALDDFCSLVKHRT